MDKIILFLGGLFLLLSCKPQVKDNIQCYIDGMKNDSTLIVFIPESNKDVEIIDTLIFNNGHASFNFAASELYEAFIIPFDLFFKFENGKSYPLPASRINFFIDSTDQIKIKARIEDKCICYKTEGNQLSEQLSIARDMKVPLFQERVLFTYNYNSNNKNKIDDDEYWKLRKGNDKKYQEQSVLFIKEHPDSEYAPRLLLEIRDKELVIELFNSLSISAKNSYFGIILSKMINGWMSTTIGLQFPEIIDTTLNGQDFKLSDLKGKYVLLDFWGSWCGPCVSEIETLKSLYDKNKDKIEIVGIACNDNIEKLKKTISIHQIQWQQLIESQTDNKEYSTRFGIRNFPTKILLDKDGQIYKIYIGIDDKLYDDINKL